MTVGRIKNIKKEGICMKKNIKRICLSLSMLMLVSLVVGCGKGDQVKNEPQTEMYSEELAKYFPTKEGTELKYFGTAEYGHTIKLNKVTDNQKDLVLDFNGEIMDMSGGEGPQREDLLFETQYILDKDSVREIQKNDTRRFSQSIMREQVVLKLPITTNATWSQKVTIDEKEYNAETRIIDISTDENGTNLVKTETTIKGLEFYPDNTYKEIKSFKEGKGLAAYEKIILLQGADGNEESTPFEFSYYLFEPENELKTYYTKQQLTAILQDGEYNHDITWSPNDQFVVYATKDLSTNQYKVFIASPYLKGEVSLTDEIDEIPSFNWNEDGSQLTIKFKDETEQLITQAELNKIKNNQGYKKKT